MSFMKTIISSIFKGATKNINTATNRSAAQPNVVKENSADRHPVVQLTSSKAGTLEVIRRVQIKVDII
jgi:hypothetical protein